MAIQLFRAFVMETRRFHDAFEYQAALAYPGRRTLGDFVIVVGSWKAQLNTIKFSEHHLCVMIVSCLIHFLLIVINLQTFHHYAKICQGSSACTYDLQTIFAITFSGEFGQPGRRCSVPNDFDSNWRELCRGDGGARGVKRLHF